MGSEGVDNLSSASEEYDKANEDEFRFMLQKIVDRLDTKLSDVASGVGQESLSSTSRLSHALPSVGVQTYEPDEIPVPPVVGLDEAYWFGHKLCPSPGLNVVFFMPGLKDYGAYGLNPANPGPITGNELTTDWTTIESTNWSEGTDSATGHKNGKFSYSGDIPASGSRKFLVNWGYTMYSVNTGLPFLQKLGRLVKDITGGSGTSGNVYIPGSERISDPYSVRAIYGFFIYEHQLSGSSIVSIASNTDTISFQLGLYIAGTGANTQIQQIRTNDDATGIQMTISPVDGI